MRALALLALTWGCASERDLELAPGTRLLVLVELTDDGRPLRLSAHERASDDVTKRLPRPSVGAARLLEYDQSAVALRLPVRIDGTIALDPDGVRLPEPLRAHDLVGGLLDAASTEALLASFTVERLDCAAAPAVRPVAGVRDTGVTTVLAVDGVGFLGRRYLNDGVPREPPAIFRVTATSSAARRVVVASIEASDPHAVASPYGFVDQGAPWFVMVRTSTVPERVLYDLVRLTLAGEVAERIATQPAPELRSFFLTDVVTGYVSGARVILGRGQVGPAGSAIATLVRLDPDDWTWRALEAPVVDTSRCASRNRATHALAFGADGRVIYARDGGRLLSFELDRGPATATVEIDIDGICVSSHVTLDTGEEIALLERPGDLAEPEPIVLAWRVAGAAWRMIDTPHLRPTGLSAIPGGFATTTSARGIALFEMEPRRPSVSPRECHRISAALNPLDAAQLDDRRWLVGGVAHPESPNGALIFEYPP